MIALFELLGSIIGLLVLVALSMAVGIFIVGLALDSLDEFREFRKKIASAANDETDPPRE